MNNKKIIYLAGAIRGDSSYREYYNNIIDITEKYAEIRTELSENYGLTLPYYMNETYKDKIYQRDIYWIEDSDAIIAEISGASTGVGYEISYAIHYKKMPVLCLYHVKSKPSLMMTQNKNKYIFIQKYLDVKEIEFFIKLFVLILQKLDSIDDRKNMYNYFLNSMKEKNININNLSTYLDELIETYNKEYKEDRFSSIIEYNEEKIDFTDRKYVVNFLLKSILLHKKWSDLKSQQLGTSFISGKKIKIISALINFTVIDISDLYDKIDIKKVGYEKEAFKKHLRAYRYIGLLFSPINIKYGSTKLKNEIFMQSTLYKEIELKSMTSKRYINLGIIFITNYLLSLHQFIIKYDIKFLLSCFKSAEKTDWYKDIKYKDTDLIDEITISKYSDSIWFQDLYNFLSNKSMDFFKTYFSSYKTK